MSEKKQQAAAPALDEEYKEATQAVVDDRMRTDVLGPRICSVLSEHTPARDGVIKLVHEAIRQNPDIQKSIEEVVKAYSNTTKVKWGQRIVGAFGTALLAFFIWLLQKAASGLFPPPQS